tara:strand:- start:1274 stop:1519 length:246 start_codon:yes stop_codon:yes gene_type:complete
MSKEIPLELLFHYKDEEGETWAYQLVPDPPAALYWKPSSYPLKLTDIKIVTKGTAQERKQLKRLILRDIQESEKATYSTIG